MKKDHILVVVQFLIFAFFLTISLGMVFFQGLCCGDDAYHAMVAKNLANGLGYASTLPLSQSHSTILLFDPYLGTGPTIILPAALIIKIVGNTYWAPGITVVFLWASLLFCISVIINKICRDKFKLTVSIITFFILAYIFFAYHFEQWYALFGEIPSALLICIAVLLYFVHDSRKYYFLIGVLFSLSFEAKVISLIPFMTFLLFVVAHQSILSRHHIKTSTSNIIDRLFFILLGFCIPILLFELYRFFSLGYIEYKSNWRQSIANILSGGVAPQRSILSRLIERLIIVKNRFGIFLPAIFIIFAGVLYELHKRNDEKLFSIYVAFVSLITIFTGYWLVYSIGWARYYIIPIILTIFIMALPFLSHQLTKSYKFIYALSLVLLSIYNIRSIDVLYPFRNIKLFQSSSNLAALGQVSDLLSSHTMKQPFLTQWWATGIDVEYTLKTSLNFTTYNDPELDSSKPHIIVINKKFLSENDDKLSEYLNHCNPREIDRYLYIECDSLNSP